MTTVAVVGLGYVGLPLAAEFAKKYRTIGLDLSEEKVATYGIRLVDWEELPQAAAVVAAVAHDEFKNRPIDAILAKLAPNGVYVDVKNQADAAALRARGIEVWRL